MPRLTIPDYTDPGHARASGLRALGAAVGEGLDEAIKIYKDSRQREGHIKRLADALEERIVNRGEHQRFGFDTVQEAQNWMNMLRSRMEAEGVTVKEVEQMIPEALSEQKQVADRKAARGAVRGLTGVQQGAFGTIPAGQRGGPQTMEEGIDALVGQKAEAAAQPPGTLRAPALPPAPGEEGMLGGVRPTAAPAPTIAGGPGARPTETGNVLDELAAFSPEGEQAARILSDKLVRFVETKADARKIYEEAQSKLEALQLAKTTREERAETEAARTRRARIAANSRIQAAKTRAQAKDNPRAWADLARKVRADAADAEGDPSRAVALALRQGGKDVQTADEAVEYLYSLATTYEDIAARLGGFTLPRRREEPTQFGF